MRGHIKTIYKGYKVELKFDTEYRFVMGNENNQYFNIDESDEMTKLKILNSALIKELRKYKEENTKLKHENEILNSIIEESKAMKSDFSIMKNQHPHEETEDNDGIITK